MAWKSIFLINAISQRKLPLLFDNQFFSLIAYPKKKPPEWVGMFKPSETGAFPLYGRMLPQQSIVSHGFTYQFRVDE